MTQSVRDWKITMHRVCLVLLVLVSVIPGIAFAQATGGVRGKVTDPSGAVVPGANVRAVAPDGQARTAVSNNLGEYEFSALPPGTYSVSARAKGFSRYEQSSVLVTAGQRQQVDITLDIRVEKEKVDVQDEAEGVDTSSENNAGAIVIKGKDLDALSDDPDDLQSELEALAGPSAGPNGGQIYIDGFTGGQLPPKSSIREIRINQNPFSAEYDKLGYGRIEIFTKPGTDKVHGRFMANGNTSALNTGNPFVKSQPDYYSTFFMGNVGGPLNKKASYNISMFRREIQSNAIVNATVLGTGSTGNLVPVPLTQAILTPRSRLDFSPRFDFQLTPNDTLTARYSYHRTHDSNSGVGQFSLPSMAYNAESQEHEIQLSETHIINPRVINETRFEYSHEQTTQNALNPNTPTINVRGAFSDGGNQLGNADEHQNYFEVQNYTSIVSGTHMFKFGARLRDTGDTSTTSAGFNGTFTYDSIYSYLLTVQGQSQGLTPSQIRATCIADPSGRIDPVTSQPLQVCGGPSQFSIITGNPTASVNLLDAGLFFQDEWKWRPNFTISYGLRFETQNHFSDHVNFAPRVAVAWGLGSPGKAPAKTVLRAGYGWFYDRLPYSSVLMQDRQLGDNRGIEQSVVNNPDFLDVAGFSQAASTTIAPTVYIANPNLRAPYTMQAAASVEHAWTKAITTSLTYLNSRGLHQFLTADVNAPLPGQFNPFDCVAGRPNGACQNIYQFESEGVFKQNQMIANYRVNGKKVSLFGFYSLSFANSSTSGIGYFPSDPYNWMADYGRASFDVRNRFLIGGNINLPYGFSAAPFMVVTSGQPYNITLGQDLTGDNQRNDRPWYIAGVTPSCTNPATFSQTSASGARLPINYCTGPSQFDLNLRLSKTIGFGPQTERGAQGGGQGGPHGPGGGRGGPPGGGLGPAGLSGAGGQMGGMFGSGPVNRRYALTFTLMAHNLFNVVNYGAPVGVLSSPQFGQSTSLAGGIFGSGSANRTINLQMIFTF